MRKLNLDKRTEKLLNRGLLLPVMEEFYSIQGEGFHTGKAAFFIRVGGCDVGCNWCDVKESWNPNHFPPKNVDDVIAFTLQSPAKTVLVTGGEPLNYNLDYLCLKLKENGFETHLETSGSSKLSGNWDWICLSPKTNKKPLEDNFKFANELKVIIETEDDFNWALENAKKVDDDTELFLQPEWSKSDEIMPQVVEFVKQNPQWKVSIQSQKYMRIP